LEGTSSHHNHHHHRNENGRGGGNKRDVPKNSSFLEDHNVLGDIQRDKRA